MPPVKTDIVAEMRSSPLYGRNPLFTRMAEGMAGIEAFAQASPPSFNADDIRRAFPKSAVAGVLSTLYSSSGSEWLDQIDEANAASIDKAANDLTGQINSAAAAAANRDKSRDAGIAKLRNIGIFVVLSRLAAKPEFSEILGPIAPKLAKISRVASSRGFAQSLATIDVFLDERAISGELTAISEGMTKKERNSSDRILPSIMSGVSRGLAEVSGIVPAGAKLKTPQDEVARLVSDYVVPAYSRKLETDKVSADLEPLWLVAFGQNVAAMTFIAMNKETFSTSRQAVVVVGRCNANLSRLPPFRGDWGKLLTKEMRSAIQGFNAVEDEAAPEGLPLDQIITVMLRGASKGMAEVRVFASGQPIPVEAERQILLGIRNNAAPAMERAIVTDAAKAEEVAANIAALTLMATNPRSFSSLNAKGEFGRRRSILPPGWKGLVERKTASAIENFRADSPEPTSQKKEVQEAFLDGKNGQEEWLANARQDRGMPEKDVEADKLAQIDEEFNTAAGVYFASSQNSGKMPTSDQAKRAGEAFYRLMLVFAAGIEERSERDMAATLTQVLDEQAWPGWRNIISRSERWMRNGIIDKIKNNVGNQGRGAMMSRSQYQNLFNRTYAKIEEKVKQGIDARLKDECKPSDLDACASLNSIKNSIGSDNLVLARPAAIEKWFGPDETAAGASVGTAQTAVAVVVNSIKQGEEIDDAVIEEMANQLVVQIGVRGSAVKGSYEMPNSFDKDNPSFKDFPEYIKEQEEKKKQAEQAAANVPIWGMPATIMFGALVLWHLYRGTIGMPPSQESSEW